MRNVALVVLDTVRKDYFDEYAPRLRERSGASYEQCRAASSWSLPSHTSILTGDLPSTHGFHAESFDASFSYDALDRSDTFLDDLPDHTAVGLSANAYVNTLFEFDRFFDAFHDFSIGSHTGESLFTEGMAVQDYMKQTDEPDALKRRLGFLAACLDHDHPAKSLANGVWSQVGPKFKSLPLPEFVDDGAATISQTAADSAETVDEPFFLFANFMDAHTPLRNLVQHDRSLHSVPDSWSSTQLDKWELNKEGKATEEYTQHYRDVYGASIDYLDRVVDGLVDDLERATGRETTVVVVSDHGHNLGYDADDGLFHHTGTMTEGVLHTPCEIINPPEGYPETETRYLSHLELGDLLVALAHDEAPPDDLHRELVPSETIGLLGEGDGTWGREFSDDEYAHWNRMIRVVYDGTTKYQWNSLGESYEYDLDPDRPGWQAETATDVPIPTDATDLFDEDVIAYKDSAADRTKDMSFDDSVTDRLEQLGYL